MYFKVTAVNIVLKIKKKQQKTILTAVNTVLK